MASLQLEATINDELRWREAELAIAKLHLHRSLIDNSAFSYSYRCFVILTYAHYEAFTTRVISQAMRDIFESGVKWSECRASIRRHLFATGLRKIIDRKSNEELALTGSLKEPLIDDVTPPPVSIIMDCANLNFSMFTWAIESIGLDAANYGFARPDIGRLVAMRHNCAHGEALTFDPTKSERELASGLFELQQRIVTLLHYLSIEIIDHFDADGFREP